MCGIAGYSISKTDAPHVNARAMAQDLLRAIESRGRDASGIAWSVQDKVWFQKEAITASKLAPLLESGQARTLIAHTRWATQGSPDDNGNNHPIHVDGLVGVHNGVINNDDALFRDIGCARQAKVDTEAIFALLRYGPGTVKGNDAHATELLPLLRGRAAIAWITTHDAPGTLHLARVSDSPLVIAQSDGGSLVFASTEHAVREAMRKEKLTVNYVQHVPEGTYLRVVYGRIHDVLRFDVPKSLPAWKANYTKASPMTSMPTASTTQKPASTTTNVTPAPTGTTTPQTPQKPTQSSGGGLTKAQRRANAKRRHHQNRVSGK